MFSTMAFVIVWVRKDYDGLNWYEQFHARINMNQSHSQKTTQLPNYFSI